MTDLFPIPETPSPRLAWMKKHSLSSRHYSKVEIGFEDEFSGERIYPWIVYSVPFQAGGQFCGDSVAAGGDTEDEALTNWAKANGVKLWNEEGL
jgi:hypothetical protein